MDFKTFEYEMRNYTRYKKEYAKMEERIDDIIYTYAGVKGIRYDKERNTFSPNLAKEVRYKMEVELRRPQQELEYLDKAIKRCEAHLQLIPEDVRKMCSMLFIDGKTYEAVGRKFGYSKNGLRFKVMREVEKI